MTSGAAGTETGHAGVFQTLRETPTAARFALVGVFVNQFGAFVQFFLVLYLTERGFSNPQAGLALGASHATFQLGYAIGPILGVLLWTALGDAFWALVCGFGLAMVAPGIWGMRAEPVAPPASAPVSAQSAADPQDYQGTRRSPAVPGFPR